MYLKKFMEKGNKLIMVQIFLKPLHNFFIIHIFHEIFEDSWHSLLDTAGRGNIK